jgi:hypothetical protein
MAGEIKKVLFSEGTTVTAPTASPLDVGSYAEFIESSAPSTPSAGYVRAYAKTDKKIYTKDSSGTEVQLGAGGSGELNLIENASDSNNWSETGTRFNSYPVTTTTAGDLPLGGIVDTAIQIISSTTVAGDETTDYVSYAFTTPASLAAKLKVEFYMRPGSNFVASEWTVSVYATSTRQDLTTDSSGFTYLPNASGKFTTTFHCAASTAYTLRFTRKVAGAASAATLNICNVIVGPGIQPQGAVVGRWQSYTPTSSFTTNSNTPTGRYRQVGESMEVEIRQSFTGAPDTVTFSISIPSGFTIDTTKLVDPSTGGSVLGSMVAFNGADAYSGSAVYNNTTTVRGYGPNGTAAFTQAVPFTLGSGDVIEGRFTVPIAEWAGSGTVNLAQNDVDFAADDGSADVFGPNGALVPNQALGTLVTRTFAFPSTMQETDNFFVEVKDTVGWHPAEYRLPLAVQGTKQYGIKAYRASATTFSVEFGDAGITSDNATYANNGATSWATLYAAGWRFRVRKASGGQAVGFGEVNPGVSSGLVSASGLKGRTDGTAVAAGYVGEVYDQAGTSNTINAATNLTSKLFQPGVWHVTLMCTVDYLSGSPSAVDFGTMCFTTSSTPAITGTMNNDRARWPLSTGGTASNSFTYILNLSVATTLYLHGEFSTTSSTGVTYGRIRAVRIA